MIKLQYTDVTFLTAEFRISPRVGQRRVPGSACDFDLSGESGHFRIIGKSPSETDRRADL